MHENVPVRFGRGRLDSLVTKGLAAYLIPGRKFVARCLLDDCHPRLVNGYPRPFSRTSAEIAPWSTAIVRGDLRMKAG